MSTSVTLDEIERLQEALDEFGARLSAARERVYQEGRHGAYSTREFGALRRGSLDLSQTLADFRQGRLK